MLVVYFYYSILSGLFRATFLRGVTHLSFIGCGLGQVPSTCVLVIRKFGVENIKFVILVSQKKNSIS
ncbi:MAG: hypothetical protein KAG19_06855, partial [Methylococcales bacterium]|nr:hypothetical protein [Methylococcales bacterium]